MNPTVHASTPASLDGELIPQAPGEEIDVRSLIYHQLCRADEFHEGEGKPFTVNGSHIAVFLDNGEFQAVDNRCPHMGYPMSKGSVRDGVLICHWHHWEFDLKTGGCFETSGSGNDLKSFPVEVREDGYLYIGMAADERQAARQRMIDRGRYILEQGLKDRSSLIIAKGVTALRHAEASPQEIIQQGLFYGSYKTTDGFSSGLAILTLCANLWHDIADRDHNLFLVHGLTQVSRRTTGGSRRQGFPFPKATEEPDLDTYKRWFRRLVEQRNSNASQRILITLNNRGFSKEAVADVVFTAATDFYFTGDGHALDFANKLFEALDFVDWQGASEILRPIVIDLITRTRHEETARWQDSVPVLEDIFTRLDDIWRENQRNEAPLDTSAFTRILLGEEIEPIVSSIEDLLRKGVDPTLICRSMVYASAIRTTRFHLKNEGDWHDVANIYSYAHALYSAFHRAPSRDLLRGIFHGAVYLTYLRWLNMPAARVPRSGQRLSDAFDSEDQMLARLQEFADFQKVYEAEMLVNQYLEEGRDISRLKHTLAHIMLREDAELHMFQVLEVAFRHFELTDDPDEKRMHLLAATRYITAQKVMKAILWSTENAERLQRGDLLSEREDDN